MTDTLFQAAGPLPLGSPAYVERQADRQALNHLDRMEYIQLIEPRQQGKTSLLYHLYSTLREQGYLVLYVDAESLAGADEHSWYEDLVARLLVQVRNVLPYEGHTSIASASMWRGFLLGLSQSIANAGSTSTRLVVAIDEVGSIPQQWSEGFFRVLREIFTVREIETDFRRISFIFAGAFNPQDLLKDPSISPFNVAQRVLLHDFSLSQVRELIGRNRFLADQADAIAERIYYWTSGQPFLTQKVALYLVEVSDGIADKLVDQAVIRLLQEDVSHLPRIHRFLKDNAYLLEFVRRIVSENINFTPSFYDWLFTLSSIVGVIKPDANNHCRIRNPIYEMALLGLLGNASPNPSAPLRNVLLPTSDNIMHWHRLLAAYQDRLRPLEVQKARKGYSTPPEIEAEIEYVQQQIAELERKLQFER
jgi:hypothetical protein